MKKIFTLAAAGVFAATTFGAQAQTIDGTRDASYPAPLAVQINPTGFSDSSVGTAGNGGANGDELDNISAQIVGSNLYLFIGGNLQSNNNHLEIFFDSKAGGQNQLAIGTGTSVLDTLSGIKFDAGFQADYLLSVSVKGTSTGGATPTASFASVNVYYATVGNSAAGAYVGRGTTPATSAPLTFGSNTGAVAVNNSNTDGVSATAVGTPATVNTGLELMIPLAALGASANSSDIKICAFTNGAKHDYLSNQVLAGFPNGTANLGDGTGNYVGGSTPVSKVDFTAYAGNQYVTVANGGPLATATPQERAQISVSPNPAQGRFLVQLPATVADLHLTLYNNLGQVVRQVSPSAGATSVAIEASGLATGVYLLRTMSGADALSTQRVVLN